MSPARRHYSAFGLSIASDILLPELGPGRPPSPTATDLVLRLQPVPQQPEQVSGVPLVMGEQDLLLNIEGIARFRIRGGREILFDPYPDVSVLNLRVFLLGSAFGALCHQRRLLPLHANAIVVQGRAVAFAGPSGMGKSTLAAHFQSRGYPVLCDDVCVLSFDGEGRPLAWPGLPRLKLWGDAAAAFGHDRASLERAVDNQEKYSVPVATPVDGGPFPLAALYVLGNADSASAAGITRLNGVEAVQAVLFNTYRSSFLRPMGLAAAHFQQAAALARHVRILRAFRPRGFEVFEAEAAKLERDFKAGGVPVDEASSGFPQA